MMRSEGSGSEESAEGQQRVGHVEHVVHVSTQAEFARRLRDAGGQLVVVDFFARWCGPCRSIAPQLEQAAADNPDVLFLKVDIDELDDVTMEYEVSAMPTFYFIKKGRRIDHFTGANMDKVLSLVKKYK